MASLALILKLKTDEEITSALCEYNTSENYRQDTSLNIRDARKFCTLISAVYQKHNSDENSERTSCIIRTILNLMDSPEILLILFKAGLSSAIVEVSR